MLLGSRLSLPRRFKQLLLPRPSQPIALASSVLKDRSRLPHLVTIDRAFQMLLKSGSFLIAFSRSRLPNCSRR